MELYSKRNHVHIIMYHGQRAVKKDFMKKKDYMKEMKFYSEMSKQLPIPKVREQYCDSLILEYLPFPNFYDLLMTQEKEGFSVEPWEALWHWLVLCEKRSGLLPSDGNLRNFLWNGEMNEVIGIDFEEYEKNSLIECGANLCAQLEIYRPCRTTIKKQIENFFRNKINSCDSNYEMQKACLMNAKERLAERREKNRLIPVSALVLSGGKSSRMGQDKASLPIQEKTLLQWQYEKLEGIGVEEVLISGARYIPDIFPEKGPLGGLHACFKKAQYTNCIVISIDCPLVPEELLQELIAKHLTSEFPVTIVKNGDRLEPLIGVYRTNLVGEMQDVMHRNQYSVMRLLDKVGFQTLNYMGDPDLLVNCNTRQDFDKVLKIIKDTHYVMPRSDVK